MPELSKPVDAWSMKAQGDFMSELSTAHSIQIDDNFAVIMSSFTDWAMDK